MFRSLASLMPLVLMGCHTVCGSTAPFWVQAECVLLPDELPEYDDLTGCDAVVRVLIDGEVEGSAEAGDIVQLSGQVENLTQETLELAIIDRCPDGLMRFDGLGEDADVYGSCEAGECASHGETMWLTIEPGEALMVDLELAVDGDTCNPALDDGMYAIEGSLELVDASVEVCSRGASLAVAR